MEVILLERVEKLGQMGDVVAVKPGYARNFLIPQKKALRATEANKRHFEGQKAQLEAANLKLKGEAEAVAAKLDEFAVALIRQAGEAGQLYGSVNARDIAIALTDAGFTVNRQQIVLAKPIKTLGLHPVQVKLHPEVIVTVTANVARSDEEAQIQAETGKAVIGGEEEAAETDVEEAAAEAQEALVAQAEEVFEDGTAEEVVAKEAASEEGADDAAAPETEATDAADADKQD